MRELPIKAAVSGKFKDSTRSRLLRQITLLLILAPLVLLNQLVPVSAETKPKHVLVLVSFRPTSPVASEWSRGIRSVLKSVPPPGIKVDFEYLDIARFNNDQYLEMLLGVYRYKYSKINPDLIITVNDPSLDFVLEYGADLFTGIPVVFAGVERSYMERQTIGANATGIVSRGTYKETLDLALKMHPGTRQVTVVAGSGRAGQAYINAGREVFKEYEDRIGFTYLVGLPMKDILEKVANLSGQTFVIYLPVMVDGAGKKFVAPESLSLVSQASAAPVYSCWEILLGSGIVGGYLYSFEVMGRVAAELGLRILSGERVADIPLVNKPEFEYMFDWRQLKRWSISEDSLPPGSIVKFKQLTIWDRYKGRIIGAIALFVLQALIILFLLQQRRIRRQAEEELLQTEQKYRTVADYTYDWEYWANIDGSLEYVSPSCERISGYSVQDFKENPALFREIIVYEDKESWDAHALKFEKALKPGEIQFRIKRKDGKMSWIEHACQPVTDSQGALLGFRSSNRDITARKQAELDARKHRAELTHVSRIATLGELSASLAHELNQPLTAILSNAQAARRFLTGDLTDPDEVNEILDDIIHDDKRAADMIKRLRALMRKKDLEFTSLDLNKVVRGIAELANREVLTKDVALVLDLADGLPQVRGDTIHLEQVVLNLILNGTQAMESLERQPNELQILTAKHDENAMRVSVRDKGTGIDEAHIYGIFEAFYTTKTDGMGMGLSICRSIIEAHGGRLWAENNPDQGATVSFTVPISTEDQT